MSSLGNQAAFLFLLQSTTSIARETTHDRKNLFQRVRGTHIFSFFWHIVSLLFFGPDCNMPDKNKTTKKDEDFSPSFFILCR